jgi:hypothetical protein
MPAIRSGTGPVMPVIEGEQAKAPAVSRGALVLWRLRDMRRAFRQFVGKR